MFRVSILVIFLLFFACKRNEWKDQINFAEPVIPNIFLSQTDDKLSVKNDVVFYEGKEYSGFLILINESKDTLSRVGYFNGLLSGISRKSYPNKQLMEERHYLGGKKNGLQVSFWENGNKRFEFIAQNDAYEGEMKEWDVNGKLFHLAHFVHGQEEGVQKLWYDNGKIRANYIIIKGKRYGLLGTKNCKNVSDSIFVVQ
jgi:antitoxin component YwqK of YwqJK toxin-antitoxin module